MKKVKKSDIYSKNMTKLQKFLSIKDKEEDKDAKKNDESKKGNE